MKAYSIVIPVYNEEESLQSLFDEILSGLTDVHAPFEIVFINDCSSDRSPDILEQLKKEFPALVRVIHLKNRSGQTFALKQGINAADGDVIITLDADLQNDPADIPKLLKKMGEGFDVVCGWRKSRQDKFLKAMLSKTGNVLQRVMTGMCIHDISCTLRAYRKECAKNVPLEWEGQHRFIPLSLSLRGYKIGEIVANHRLRKYGYSKYSHKRIFKVVIDFFRVLLSPRKRGRRRKDG